MSLCTVRFHSQSIPVGFNCRVQFADFTQRVSQVDVGLNEIWFKFDDISERDNCFFDLLSSEAFITEVEMCGDQLRIELDRTTEGGDGRFELALFLERDAQIVE